MQEYEGWRDAGSKRAGSPQPGVPSPKKQKARSSTTISNQEAGTPASVARGKPKGQPAAKPAAAQAAAKQKVGRSTPVPCGQLASKQKVGLFASDGVVRVEGRSKPVQRPVKQKGQPAGKQGRCGEEGDGGSGEEGEGGSGGEEGGGVGQMEKWRTKLAQENAPLCWQPQAVQVQMQKYFDKNGNATTSSGGRLYALREVWDVKNPGCVVEEPVRIENSKFRGFSNQEARGCAYRIGRDLVGTFSMEGCECFTLEDNIKLGVSVFHVLPDTSAYKHFETITRKVTALASLLQSHFLMRV